MKHQNCWDFWNCPKDIRDNCPAFLTFYGKDCFDFAEDYCVRMDSGFQKCTDCAWYKKTRPEIERKEKEAAHSSHRKDYFKS